MRAITKLVAGSVAMAALAAAAPAAAQYYPGTGYPGYGNGMPGGGYGYGYGYNNPYGYGVDSQTAVNQCASAVQARLSGGYGAYGGGYGYNGYGGYGGGRVLGISRVEQRAEGGVTVRGVATSGYAGYGYAPNTPDLVWRCRTDFRGVVVDVDVNRAQRNYGYQYTPWNNDYSQYGYYRY